MPQSPFSAVPNGWFYENTPNDDARFVLGTVGQNPLVCVGVNPSTATPWKLDPTVERVKRRAAAQNFDSWIMLNLYPQRSTDPTGMHLHYLPELMSENEERIAELMQNLTAQLGRVSLLAAWGILIDTRPYLPGMARGIAKIVDDACCDWVSIGEPLVDGHPRHPSRAPYALPLVTFDMGGYLKTL
ncbi:DUF1643 domain-containing protein [Microbacterium sp. NPDC064584]|uniref:DUF1643 domain-containing protein n=1 Tax=Microbacterium sp. NPDC064584 TaxID=3155817 RepID=UPI00343EF2A5